MGQTKSKVDPISSHPPASIREISTVEEISTPAPPRHITRLSELIDLRDLFEAESPTPTAPNSPTFPTSLASTTLPNSPNSANFPDSSGSPNSLSPLTTRRSKSVMVQSPSGNILSPQEFLQRPDRKLTMEERKQSIRINTENQIQRAESKGGKDRKDKQNMTWRWFFCCCGA